jgi:MSHA biogenesis protein MshJ
MWQKKLKRVEQQFNHLILRERLLLLAAVLAGFYMVFDLVWISPAQKQQLTQSASVDAAQKQLDGLRAEETVLAKVIANDPNIRLKKQQDALVVQLKQLDAEIIALSQGLVTAEQLAAMLQEVLKLSGQLQLQRLSTQLPQRLEPASAQQDTAKEAEKNPATAAANPAAPVLGEVHLYRQPVSLVLRGNYFEVLDYLKKLEATAWRFYWDALFYKVVNHPEAEVEIRVYGLSVEKT